MQGKYFKNKESAGFPRQPAVSVEPLGPIGSGIPFPFSSGTAPSSTFDLIRRPGPRSQGGHHPQLF